MNRERERERMIKKCIYVNIDNVDIVPYSIICYLFFVFCLICYFHLITDLFIDYITNHLTNTI